MNARAAAVCLMTLLPAAAAARVVDFSDPAAFASAPVWRAGRVYTLYEDKDLGVHFLRVQPKGKRAVLRFRSHTINVSVSDQRYFSSKIVSTREGVKQVAKKRGDFSYHRPGNVTGGWFVGSEGTFDMLYLSYPAAFPEVMGEDAGRKAVSDAKHGISRRVADAFAAVDASSATPRRATVLAGKRLKVELLRFDAAAGLANPGREAAVLLAVKGEARASAGGEAASPLGPRRLLIVGGGEPFRVVPSSLAPFYALLVTRSSAPESALVPDKGPFPEKARSTDAEAAFNEERARRRQAGAAAAGKAPRPVAGKGGLEWLPIPGGRFVMGSGAGDEAPAHRVDVKPFEMTRSAVTFGQYKACVAAGACAPVAEGCAGPEFSGDAQPVVCVDWFQAEAFAAWAGGRLPSEAEREYAARSGGKARRYPWGDEEATCAWTVMSEQGVAGCGRERTWPVCSKPQGDTDQGLCDMAGNVWEWVQDHFRFGYAGAPTDGGAWERPSKDARPSPGREDARDWPGVEARSQRGGAWIYNASFARATSRTCDGPNFRGNFLGFRLAR